MPLRVSTGLSPELAQVPGQVRRLEALGVDSVFAGETQHNPFLPLVLAAEHSERMEVATSVAIAFPRVPHVTANIAWDLASYSGGRFVLGLGTQVKAHNERRFSVPWTPPGPHLRDYIACMRAIWDSWQHGTKPDYQGEHYQYRLTSPSFNPGPIAHPEIPVVISAVSPFNARLAGEVADGIAVHPFSTFRYIREVLAPALHEGAREVRRNPACMQIRGGGYIVMGKTQADVDRALVEVRREIAFHASSRSSVSLMGLHGWEGEVAQLRRLATEGRSDEMGALVSDEMLDAFCVIATWDDLVARVREKYEGIVTHVTVPLESGELATPDDDAQMREVIAEIQLIPALGDPPAATPRA